MSQWIFLRCAPWNIICQLGLVHCVGLFIYFVWVAVYYMVLITCGTSLKRRKVGFRAFTCNCIYSRNISSSLGCLAFEKFRSISYFSPHNSGPCILLLSQLNITVLFLVLSSSLCNFSFLAHHLRQSQYMTSSPKSCSFSHCPPRQIHPPWARRVGARSDLPPMLPWLQVSFCSFQ